MVLGVDGIVQAAHVGGGKFSGEIGQGRPNLGKPRESGLANDGDSVVGRKIVKVVDERDEAERVNEAVGGIPGNDVHLMVEKGAVDEAEIHDAGRRREAKRVAIAPAAEAVGALEEFVADTDMPLRSNRGEVGHGAKMEFSRIEATDDHGKGVFKSKRISNGNAIA